MMAQKATELRRLRAEVKADQAALRARQQELEVLLCGSASDELGRGGGRRRAICWTSLPKPPPPMIRIVVC